MKTVIEMAQEAGFNRHHNPDLYDFMVASGKAIEAFAALVAAASAAAENEACAKVCDETAIKLTSNGKARVSKLDMHTAKVLRYKAAEIRARGQA
jgi:hypothetical protein